MTYFHQRQYRQTQEQIIFFPRKKKQGVARIQVQIVSNFTSKQFLFSKCKIKISRFILNRYSFTKLEKERNERMLT